MSHTSYVKSFKDIYNVAIPYSTANSKQTKAVKPQ